MSPRMVSPRISWSLAVLALVTGCTSVSLGGGVPSPTFGPQEPPSAGVVPGSGTHRVRYDVTCTRCTVDYTNSDGRITHVDARSGGWQRSIDVPGRMGSVVLTATPAGDRARVTALRIYVDDSLRADSHPGADNEVKAVTIAAALPS